MDLGLRKTYRSNLTKLLNSVNAVLESEETTATEIYVLIGRIKSLDSNLNSVNQRLFPTYSEEQIEAECEKIAEYQDQVVTALAKLEYRLNLETAVAPARNGQGPQENERDTGVQEHHPGNSDNSQTQDMSVRLPKLELCKFNGDISTWPAFWEQYKVAVHENGSLNEAAKFAYLKTYITGKAAITIAGLTSSHSSYKDAIELLKDEFGNSERIIDIYIQKLLSIPPVKHERDIASLRKLYNVSATTIRSLNTLGLSPEQYGLLVKSIIFKALPYNLHVAYKKQKLIGASNASDTASGISNGSDREEQIDNLLMFIKIELDSIDQAQCDPVTNSSNIKSVNFTRDNKGSYKSKSNVDTFTAAGLLAFSKKGCLFCKTESHQSADCNNSSLDILKRKDILKQTGCCFRCTKQGHSSKNCKVKIVCNKCKLRHATSMCDPSFVKINNESVSHNHRLNNSGNETRDQAALLSSGRIDSVYLKTACCFILSNNTGSERLIRMVIDGGSQMTFIREDVSRLLGLPIVGKQKISINSFGSSKSAPARLSNRVEIKLRSQHDNNVVLLSAIEVPEICFDCLDRPSLKDKIIGEFSTEYNLADNGVGNEVINGISLLVGADFYWQIVTGETKPLSSNLMAVNTKFGWTLLGSQSNSTNDEFIVNFNSMTSTLNVQTTVEDFDIRDFWSLETIGINANEKTTNNFTENFTRDNIQFINGRYEISLPWKSDSNLDSNYIGAFTRIKSLISKLLRTGKPQEYDKAIREYLINDCAERVLSNSNNPRTYYMPHRPVYRDDKATTKVRVVFDASAHASGLASLNDHLFSGDNLVPDLLKVLLNFRCGAIGLVADIEKAFLQISLETKDRDSHCFLWFSEPVPTVNSLSELPELTIFRMTRVTFGVTTSPFFLSVVLRKHFAESPQHLKETAILLSQSFYVDDLVISADSQKDALVIYEQSKEILTLANMNLRKWNSNSSYMIERFRNDGSSLNGCETQKVLGILWNSIVDELSVDLSSVVNSISDTIVFTKRIVLQTVAKVFDPMGVLGPFTVRAKILLQCIWKERLDWDTILPKELNEIWLKWCTELSKLLDNHIPRCVISSATSESELHIFADACQQAYGVVAYVKCLTTNEVNFFMSKNRVAPVNQGGNKELTLPKLELTAALCAARLQYFIIENSKLNIKNMFLWSDSKIALYWIHGEALKWKPYVQNRVNEIKKISKGQWRYCPGKNNPADLLTRGVSATFLLESSLWLQGPTWLAESIENWPQDERYVTIDSALVAINSLIETPMTLVQREPIFRLDKYEKLEKIIRVTAYVFRFIHNIRKNVVKLKGPLTSDELKIAENHWLSFVQHIDFPDEVTSLLNKKAIKVKSSILTLSPFLDESGILRLGGRLQEASIPYETRHPILLAKQSLYSEKIIKQCHERVHHSGVNATLANIREKYWIIQGRQRVKSVLSKCLKCKRLRGKAGNELFAPLPRNRMLISSPFKVIGIDFAGPLYILEDGKRTKTYIMLITCAVIRAVHLELVPNLTTESCIRGLRRFIARRGVPEIIYSDNAKTFHRTALEIQELFAVLRNSQVQEFAQKYRITWYFIVERAAWWGGFWERMVRTIKDALKITLGKALIGQDELQTILAEVEATVNSRPLTYVDNDNTNLLILSPAHFLIGNKDGGFSMAPNIPKVKRDTILEQWNTRERLMKTFWNKWSVDYLQQLRSVHRTEPIKSRTFKVNDIALLHEDKVQRLQWKLVKITEVYQGRDGRIRSCEIQTSDGTKLRRPIQLLYPLEVEDSPPGEDVKNRGT